MNDMLVKEKTTVKTGQKLAFGLGDLGYSMVNNTIGSFILFFGNTVVGVPGTLMGLAIAISTIWDAITDPLVGYLSDTFNFKLFGRRHGFILVGGVALSVANILIWSIPLGWGIMAKFVYFTVMVMLLKTCTTLFSIPNQALSIEISRDYNERSNIQVYRSVFAIAGLLMPTLLMGVFQKSTAEYPDGRFNPMAYVNYAYVASAAAVLTCVIMFISTYSHVPKLRAYANRNKTEGQKAPGFKSIITNFFSILKNKNYRSIIISYSIAMMSSTIIVAFGFNVFTFTFKTNTTQMYLIMAGLFLMTILSQPLWLYLSKKKDKKKAMLLGLIISLVGCVMLFVMFLFRGFFNGLLEKGFSYVVFLMPPLMVAGFGVGVLFSMPLALIGDVIIVENRADDREKTASFTGMMTFANKLSQAFSQLVLGILLDVIGFQSGSATQTPLVESLLGWILCIGVSLSIILGIIFFSGFSINRKQVQEELSK